MGEVETHESNVGDFGMPATQKNCQLCLVDAFELGEKSDQSWNTGMHANSQVKRRA